jgi:hypothetical protein
MDKVIYLSKMFNFLIIEKKTYYYSFIKGWFWTNYILQEGAINERGKNG